MTVNRIKFNNIVQNQLPGYVRNEYPLVAEFLKSYYQGQEYQGGPIDLAQNIDDYVKVDSLTNLIHSVGLGVSVGIASDTIEVDMQNYPTGTEGFPDSYGLIKINDEIITYTGITTFAFTGCVRGFSGITSYKSSLNPEELVFETTVADEHDKGDTVQNLSTLFLKEFLYKTKTQITPGFEGRQLDSDLDQNIFLKQTKDFYLSKGTDRGFEILFKALYNENVKIIRPSEFLFTPSNANYKFTNDFVVEPIVGDPLNLELSTLYQDAYGDDIEKAYAPITHVEPINVSAGTTFYRLSIDAGYNRDSRVDGAIYGNFSVPARTKVIGNVSAGTTVLNVDSTVGFGTTGELHFKYIDGTVGISSYTSKNLTQFFGVGIAKTITSTESVGINTFAYGRSSVDQDEIIEVRLTSVLESLKYKSHNSGYESGNTIKIKTLGIGDTGFKFSNWFYNIAPTYNVKSNTLKDSSDFTYQINLDVDHQFRVGDTAVLKGNDGIDLPKSTVSQIVNSKSFIVKGQGEIRDFYENTPAVFTIQRNITLNNAINFEESSIYSTDVQNVYKEKSKDKLIVASSSLPSYEGQSLGVNDGEIVFEGAFTGDQFEIINSSTTTPSGVPVFDHGFYTGDAVYYTPQIVNESYVDPTSGTSLDNFVIKSSLAKEGLYFVHRVNATTLKLAKSRSDIDNSKFINLDTDNTRTGIVTDNKLIPYDFHTKTLKSQKLIREVCPPENDGSTNTTNPGKTGILINGVEILNYKSFDKITYGELENIKVLGGGRNYDVINPPFLHIKDSVGTGATGFVAVSGSLKDIRIIDPGFDYQEIPTIKISGGNGSGANVSVNMQQVSHSVSFNSNDPLVGLGTTGTLASTIGFGTYHKFKNAEEVIYVTNDQQTVGGMTTSSTYFVSHVGTAGTIVRLHKDEAGALAGINTITLTSNGVGKQFIKSLKTKSTIESINIVSGGSGYQNKKRTCNPVGINTALDTIKIKNHDYESGEIVSYNCDGTPISGLTTSTDFYITKVDDDNFKLSSVGVGTTNQEFYYNTKQYRPLTSIGIGTHTFNYQPITATLTGKVGLSSIGSETFEGKIQPIIRGEITSIHLSENGVGYGSSEIINFVREPEVTLLAGSEAQLSPVISNGSVVEVIVENKGKNYNAPPNLQIIGDGSGLVVTPVLKVVDLNGNVSAVGVGTTTKYVLDSVNVIQKGTGYTKPNTSISVVVPGTDVKVRSNIQKWTVNLFEKKYLGDQIANDDGILTKGLNKDFELQYTHLYAPRKLRESVYSTTQEGKSLYGEPDLRRLNGQEVNSDNHSPIIGWAYDGNPIYGPYGYIKKDGGTVVQMKSGYVEESSIKENRPSLSAFPGGFFVEDYTYKQLDDDTVLDENNGRFCITPQYPHGTYAYFATVSDGGSESSGQFNSYRLPKFPYLIGEDYHSLPNEFNFNIFSNQDSFDFKDTDWCRNTAPYNLIEGDTSYSYFSLPDKLSQTAEIKSVKPGIVENIGIITGGSNYQIGDKAIFDNVNTRGTGVSAVVSKILGKEVNSVSVATSSISNVEIYPSDRKGSYTILADNPHNWINTNTISILGLSTTSSKIEGSYIAGISSNRLILTGIGTTAVAIGTDGSTGIVTHINVAGDLSFPKIRSNDILGIGTEQVKVLNVEVSNSRIRVLRAFNGVTGVSHTITSEVIEDPRKLTISAGFNSTYDFRLNKQIYFNPVESVGLGTISGVGIGSTIVFSNPGIGLSELFVKTKEMYLPKHGLKTGDKLTYSPNAGEGINIRQDGAAGAAAGITTLINGQTLFAAVITEDFIGISTCRVGLGTTGTFVGIASTQRDSTTVFFSGVGTGVYHSFKTNYDVITGSIQKNTVTVSTAQTHGLLNNENVYIDVNPGVPTNFSVKYNDYNRRIVVNPKSFAATGVNTSTNSLTITNHGFETGDKIIHTASTPVDGLDDNGIYYIVKVDNDTFKLSKTYYDSTDSKPEIVGIADTSAGTINPINPALKVYKNSTAIFDLSDSSLGYVNQSTNYPAFRLNFYKDKNFTQIWDSSLQTDTFNITRAGTVGVTTTAELRLDVNDDVPDVLYYTLDPIFESNLPELKKEISVDPEILSGSELQLFNSLYNGKQKITVAATNQFTYTIPQYPERVSYGTTSNLSYETDSPTAYGAIKEFEIRTPGTNYYSLPGITTITSNVGDNAIVEGLSTSVGRICNTGIIDIGYDFPSDTTLTPDAILDQIVKIDSYMSLESVGVSSFGRGYLNAPDLIILDGKTNKLVDDVDLRYTLGNSNVEILKNTFGISDSTPTIIPIHNSNGVGISTVGFNTITKDVTVTLNQGFSTTTTFPFASGDNVLIEGISVGVGTTGRGYNSDQYDYKLFTLTSVDENYGGIGTITYNLSDYFTSDLAPSLTPGSFDVNNSSGRVIPERAFPIFDIKFKKSNDYIHGEVVTGSISSATGTVDTWNPNSGILRISGADNDFIVNDLIKGETTRTEGIASSIRSFDAYIKLGASSKVQKGWETDSGFFNANMQRVQDSLYYQNLSYSLSSRIDFETWDDPVSTLNHTLGFKKFADYQLESTASAKVGVTTDQIDVVVDAVGFGNLNCVHDFDIVTENSLTVGKNIVSDEITFTSRILQDYSESIGNRVVSIDDFSGTFNSNPRSTRFTTVNTWTLTDRRALKYFILVRDKRYTAQRQLMIVDLLHDSTQGYINQYGRVESIYDQGDFDFAVSGSEGKLNFYPTKFSVNDYWISSLSWNLDESVLSTATTSIGPSIIDTESITLAVGVGTTTIVGIASTYRSAKVMVEITPDISLEEYEFTQFNIVHNGTDVELLEYGQLTSNLNISGANATDGFGTYRGYIDGSSLKVDFIPNADVGIGTTGAINTILVGLADSTTTGIGTLTLNHARLQSQTTAISAAASPGITTIAEFDGGTYEGAYCFIQITDATNQQFEFQEYLVLTDYVSGDTTETYDVEWASVTSDVADASSGLGTIGTKVSAAGTVAITYTPNANIDVQTNVFSNQLRINDDSKNQIDFENGLIEAGFGEYTGTENTILRSFGLSHRTDPIFRKPFDGSDSSTIDTSNDTITLSNHFFVTGQQLVYSNPGTGYTMSVGIASTSFVGIGTTDKLPADVFAIKVNDNTIKLATTAENALKTVPTAIELSSVGIGTSHAFNAIGQNSKVLVSLDNIIQSPVVATSVTTHLADQVLTTSDTIEFAGITSFYGGDIVKIGSEIIRLDSIGQGGNDNLIRVKRPWMGTALAGYGTGTLVTKVIGNYNIVDNTLNFVEAPYGNVPLSTDTNPPDSRDWTGIATGSSFNGRMFMRSGVPDTTSETYYRNYIFDSISDQFTGIKSDFVLQSEGSNVSGLTTDGAIVLVNDVFQTIKVTNSLNDYFLEEDSAVGVTTILFTGTGSSVSGSPDVGTLPMGGVIVSVGSSEGFGYQPLVAAGGTVTVSAGGTVKSISIGNTGSGYRAGIQTVNVGIQTLSRVGTNVIGIGTAQITTGNITGIAITNTDHLFYSPRKIANVGYTSVTGLTTVTTQTIHNLNVGDEVKLSGIAFTCDYSPALGIATVGYGTATGIMTVTTVGAHGFSTTGQKSVVIFSGLGFTCALDNGSSIHYYPRGEDRAYNTSISIVGTSNTTITIDVGYSGVSDQSTHQFVSASDNAVISGGDYDHRFVSISGGAITEVSSGLGYTPTNATYDGPSGIVTFTLASHGLTTSNYVSVAQSSLVFRCSMDDYSSLHPYPRATDPIVGYGSTAITAATTNTFSINVGVSTIVNYNISTAVYSASSGILTMTLGSGGALHGLTTGTSIKLSTESLSFRCSKDSYASVHKYPRKPDPYYTGTNVTAVNSTTQFEVNVGISTVLSHYVGFGSVQSAIIAPRVSNNSASQFDTAIKGSEILRVVDSKTFETNTGISTRHHIYARGGVVNGYNEVVIDDPLSYSGIALTYTSSSSGIGTGAKADVVVGQGSSIITFTITNTGSGYGNGQRLTFPIGGTTGIPTDPSQTFTESYIEIEKVFNDEFTGWSLGQLQVVDNVERYIDGSTVDFPLTVNGDTLSIKAKRGSKIVEQELLLVFVNNIPQVPGIGYEFPGGSVITFTEAPKTGDTIQILFYKGTGDQDVVDREVAEPVQPGDELTIDRFSTQASWLEETERVPLSIDGTDRVSTDPYYGPGNTEDANLKRPITLCRQTEDKIINEIEIGKDREIYEPVINPYSYMIKSVGIGSTIVYVERLRPFFDPYDEVNEVSPTASDFSFQKKVKFISQENKTGAAGTALVSAAGTITSVIISDGGVGYSTATVSFASTSIGDTEVGVVTTSTRAFGTPIISAAGTITGIAITSVGAGYTSSNPPMVLISPPTWSEEENKIDTYQGDSGIIVGFGTTTTSGIGTQLIFDLFIPLTSDLRDSNITGTAVTISGINTGDFFVVSNSTVGSSSTSMTSTDNGGGTIGIGTQFVDNVYVVNKYEIVQSATGVGTTGVGIGTTHLNRVFVNISNKFSWDGDWPSFSGTGIHTGNYFGDYSWGKISLGSRSESSAYSAYTSKGVGGISTGAIVRRSKALKFKNFKTSS